MRVVVAVAFAGLSVVAAELPPPFPADPQQGLERTCFQTSQAWSRAGNLRSDVAIVYGIDSGLPERIDSWRNRGYRIHVMTGVSWGQYQDYLYGRFDGINHEDEAQTDRQGNKVSHGGDIYYMCPGTNYGRFLCRGVQRALDAGAEAIHLEEPEFWVRSGYSEGFKREWRALYGQDWEPPHSSVDAQWRASKLKYFLYRRALQQVFDYVQDFNRRTERQVRCYVPTHSLLNYAHWNIVSPESSLAQLKGCDGYIAQVWTGTSRTPNFYQGKLRERTFETAFLEYGAMQNLVRSTGRRVWYLNDPVEDNPNHDWNDYRLNWESTLVASLLQPEVWRYEVAPWPERVFAGKYPRRVPAAQRTAIPPTYATELQTVINALNDLNQNDFKWDCGTAGLGVLVSDSLMFERGQPEPSDPHLGNVYGLALPLLKRGMPITPVQLENATLDQYLQHFRALLLTYHGMKPLNPAVHRPLADWTKAGGILIVVDDDSDPFNRVTEWWNSDGRSFSTPRLHLFKELGLADDSFPSTSPLVKVGKGSVLWLRQNPVAITAASGNEIPFLNAVKNAIDHPAGTWKQTNHLVLRRGYYVIAAGLDESIDAEPSRLAGHFVNLFDPELQIQTNPAVNPGDRYFLIDVDRIRGGRPKVIASACKTLEVPGAEGAWTLKVEGVENTSASMLIDCPRGIPRRIVLDGVPIEPARTSEEDHLVWLRFPNLSCPRTLSLSFQGGG
ncbi:MAG TPA: hypothetical protein VL793_08480 [Patescibacteria group bacterium]|nr:hypothetical protein [Patescibacteria group bacterium]